jgi:hypothetical protein
MVDCMFWLGSLTCSEVELVVLLHQAQQICPPPGHRSLLNLSVLPSVSFRASFIISSNISHLTLNGSDLSVSNADSTCAK